PCSRQDVVLRLLDALVDLVGRAFEPARARCRGLARDLVHGELVLLHRGPPRVPQLRRRGHGVELAAARLERLLRLEQDDPEPGARLRIAEHRVTGKAVELAQLRQETLMCELPGDLRSPWPSTLEPGDACVHPNPPLSFDPSSLRAMRPAVKRFQRARIASCRSASMPGSRPSRSMFASSPG